GVTRSWASGEQERLLLERSSEAAALLSTSSSLETSMRLLSEVYASRGQGGRAFTAGARSLIRDGVTTVGVAERTPAGYVVRAVEGSGPKVGALLAGPRLDVARRASAATGLASAVVRGEPSSTLLVTFGRADALVVFQESRLSGGAVPVDERSSFRDLDAVL